MAGASSATFLSARGALPHVQSEACSRKEGRAFDRRAPLASGLGSSIERGRAVSDVSLHVYTDDKTYDTYIYLYIYTKEIKRVGSKLLRQDVSLSQPTGTPLLFMFWSSSGPQTPCTTWENYLLTMFVDSKVQRPRTRLDRC